MSLIWSIALVAVAYLFAQHVAPDATWAVVIAMTVYNMLGYAEHAVRA